MDWNLLPGDLLVDILSRIPAKSVARVRSMSKEWNTLVKSGSIANAQTDTDMEESLIILLKDLRVHLVRISLRRTHNQFVKKASHNNVKVASELYLKDPLSNSSQVDIRSVFHCDGLLLCATEDKRLVVWNPCTGETNWINPRTSYKESDYYALGYDNNRQYKILRIDRQDDVIPIKNEYEIYDFTSNSWTVLGVATDWFLPVYSRGVSVKGNTYWVATGARKPSTDFLLSFDFLTERFNRLSLPHPFPYKTRVLSVVREEQLCVSGTNYDFIDEEEDLPWGLQSWVATSTGSAMSWSKYIGSRFWKNKSKFSKGMSFLADQQDKVVVCLNTDNNLHILGEKELILKENLGGDPKWMSSCILSYVPSLAQTQQASLHGGRKRKASDL